MSKLQTTNYAGWDGKIVYGIDPDDSGVHTTVDPATGLIEVRMNTDNPFWMPLGVAPLPKTRWDWFVFDYHHGRLMRYPLSAVLAFSIKGWFRYNKSMGAWRKSTNGNSK